MINKREDSQVHPTRAHVRNTGLVPIARTDLWPT